MNEIRKLFLILLSMISIVGCVENKTEDSSKNGIMRIELSSCYNCEGCVTEFKCPRNAINSNKLKNGFEIDVSKCISCGLCKTEFKCPGNAFTQEKDITKPGLVKNFKVSEKGDGYVSLGWDGTGDDGTGGTPYKYLIIVSQQKIIDENDENLEQRIEQSGYDEKSCKVESLEAGKSYYIGIKAVDEAGNSSVISFIKISI